MYPDIVYNILPTRLQGLHDAVYENLFCILPPIQLFTICNSDRRSLKPIIAVDQNQLFSALSTLLPGYPGYPHLQFPKTGSHSQISDKNTPFYKR
jgi:hypothetical protein